MIERKLQSLEKSNALNINVKEHIEQSEKDRGELVL